MQPAMRIQMIFQNLQCVNYFVRPIKICILIKTIRKIKEAKEKRELILGVIQQLKDKGYNFSDCIYCDAKTDAYFTLRASYSFFLAEDGNYLGAVEQFLNELFEENQKKSIVMCYNLTI